MTAARIRPTRSRSRTGARSALLTFALLAAAALVPLAAAPAAAALTCSDISDLSSLYFQKHIHYRQLSDELRTRTVENFMRRIDPQRVLYLAAEAEALEASLLRVFDETGQGDCKRLRKLQHDLVARHGEVENLVRGFVMADDYALDESASLVLDPEKRSHPATKAERDALVRTLAHFQISNYQAAGTDFDEARERLVHRYELATRRAGEMTRDDLYGSFLDAFASALDPHTNYLSADVLEDFQIQMRLSLEGIGVALSERDGYSVVEQIIPGGAAARLDVLEPEDRIIAVGEDGEEPVDVIDMRLRDVVRLIRGKKGTRVHLTILRQGESAERFNVAILRDTIDLEQQAAKLRIETSEVDGRTLRLGVLELPSFYGDRDPNKRQGSRDVARLLREAQREEVDGLVLDLSRNGGGLLEDAVTISGFFIREGGVVAIRGEGDAPRVLRDPDDDVLWDGPLVVLTSRVSASASEILAGALKDYRRALIVGDDHTFGKGTVQSVFPLRPGQGALKVTTALFYRPGGTSTQHGGVDADVVIPSLFNHDGFGERNHRNSLQAESIPPFLGSKANSTKEGERWEPLADDVVAEVLRRSRDRVEDDAFFREVETELAERADDDGRVVLSELLEEREEERREQEDEGDAAAEAGDAATDQEADKDAGSAKAAPGPTTSDATGGAGSPGADTASIEPPAEVLDEDEDDALSPQAEEALRILTDLILLTS